MREDIFSPDGQYKISFASNEIRMSHWIDQPFLIRVSDGACLLKFHSLWSAMDVSWRSNSVVDLSIRLYPGLLACSLQLDVAANYGWASVSVTEFFSGTLDAVDAWVAGLKNPSKLYDF
jgi:hypothetical protein